MTRSPRLPALAAGLLLIAFALACSGGSSPSSRAAAPLLPGGTSFDVAITAPLPGALVASPPGDVHLAGTVAIGQAAAAADTGLVLALDASSASGGAAACDGGTTLLGCEVAAAKAALVRARTLGTVGQVGVALYAAAGAALDLGPGAGVQKVTGPSTDADAAGGIDVDQVLGSITPDGKAALFTATSVAATSTSYGAGLQAALDAAAASDRPARVVALIATSANGAGPAISTLTVPAGVVVHAFAVGGATCSAASANGTLADLAALGAAGSSCTDVASPATLAAALEALLDATVAEVTLAVDDGAPVALATTPAQPAQAPATLAFDATVSGLAPGAHQLCVQATGSDVGGAGTASACVSVKVATIALAPAAQVFELGTPGQTATVTATVAAAALPIAGVPVTFTITAGPNAGKTQTVTTGADGTAAFTYQALQHNAGLGTDEVQGCFTDDAGHTACATATVKWQDTTPPVVGCPLGPNPGGVIVPAAAAGFMTLTAVDAVDETPQVFLKDTGSGAVYGPFSSGVAVKYTQAPGGPPGSKPMGGGVLHVIGTGDPAVYAIDFSKNVSAPKVCPVPPMNK